MRYSLLVFRGSEAIGEYGFRTDETDRNYLTRWLRTLKPELSGVILGRDGVIGHSDNLPKDNPWYKENLGVAL